MAKKQKYYVVWEGNPAGIFSSWGECQKAIQGVQGAKYKSFLTQQEAQQALNMGYHAYYASAKKQQHKSPVAPAFNAICVDAACSGNPGIMEYRGVDMSQNTIIFQQGPFPDATNNIGEFLAIVHALALMKKRGDTRDIYSDSRTAISWVRQKKCKTLLSPTSRNKALFELIRRATLWLQSHTYPNRILKWDTPNWGEIPADFGRKHA